MNRLLSEEELASYREWVGRAAGTGTGTVPTDLSLLLGHLDAQAAELRRLRQRELDLGDVIDGLLDYVERGGADDYRDTILERARSVRHGRG